MRIAEFRQHPLAYVLLLILIASLLTVTILFWQSKVVLRIAFLCFSLGYFIWGVITHQRSSTVTLGIMAEYAGVAVLGGLLLLMLTF
ncbi:MAG: hypothetical protein WDZ94_00390 [Patescibacteria group bacterium]